MHACVRQIGNGDGVRLAVFYSIVGTDNRLGGQVFCSFITAVAAGFGYIKPTVAELRIDFLLEVMALAAFRCLCPCTFTELTILSLLQDSCMIGIVIRFIRCIVKIIKEVMITRIQDIHVFIKAV